MTYYSGSESDSVLSDAEISGLGLNLDLMFVMRVTDTFGFTMGPVADIGLSGTASGSDLKFDNFGGSAGVVALF